MVKLERMSPVERDFIRTYVSALRRDYYLVMSVVHLMHPDGLGVTDAAKATRIAVELQRMHAEFEAHLRILPAVEGFFKKVPALTPAVDDMAELFSLSFFKIFTSIKHDKFTLNKKDAGWFSGNPDEWHQLFKQLESTEQQKPSTADMSVIGLFSKFFPKLSLFKNYDQATTPTEDVPLNFWPPGFKHKKTEQEQHDPDEFLDDEYDDE